MLEEGVNTNFEHTFVFGRLQIFEMVHFEYTLGCMGTQYKIIYRLSQAIFRYRRYV